MQSNRLIANILSVMEPEDWIRIKDLYPESSTCPTCSGKKIYTYEGVDQDCDCQIQITLQRGYLGANIGKEFHTLTLNDFIGDDRDVIIPAIKGYVDDFRNNLYGGHGLTFSGRVGTGKTFAMSWVLKQLVRRGYSTYLVGFEDLVTIWANRWHSDEARWLDQKLRAVQVLGIDELRSDSRNKTGFLSQGLESVIRHRVSNNKPTLITTNLTSTDEEAEFTKTYSLLSGKNERVHTEGSDIRGTLIRERNFCLRDNGERRPVV